MSADLELALDVRQLNMSFSAGLAGRRGSAKILRDVSLHVPAGETLGLVGESGSGKSTLARCVARVLRPTSGVISVAGTDIASLGGRALRSERRNVQMIFQNSLGSLDPRMTIRRAIQEPMRAMNWSPTDSRKRVSEVMESVGLPEALGNRYPHQLSGGQVQRVGIARALAIGPRLLVADEPVSALDVSIQAMVLQLLGDLQEQYGFGILFISHDLVVVEALADSVAVMYLGEIVEFASSRQIFESPKHPYTQALLSASPLPDPVAQRSRSRIVLSGELPTVASRPPGCSFHTRCPVAIQTCATTDPAAHALPRGAMAKCHLVDASGNTPNLLEWSF